jgi:hypothetical protein
MDTVQPGQLIGLVAALVLVVVVLLSVNFREEIGAVCQGLGEFLIALFDRFVVVRLPGSEGDHGGADTGATLSVLPPQHQTKPELVPDLAAIKTYLKQHSVSDQDAIDILALLRRPTGDNLISANKIRDIVGGNEAAVKAQVAALRPKPPQPRTQGHADRPANGW